MNDTTRDLIQRLVDALTNSIRVIRDEEGIQHISKATPVLIEARAFLDQSVLIAETHDYLDQQRAASRGHDPRVL